MDTQGYRARYYEACFPAELRRAGGNVDKVAQKACRAFLEGMAWVHRWAQGRGLKVEGGPSSLQARCRA